MSFYYYSGHRIKCEITNKLKMTILTIEYFKFFFFSFQLSGEVILQIASEPVLPFSALDIALGVQNSLKGECSLNAYNFDEWKVFKYFQQGLDKVSTVLKIITMIWLCSCKGKMRAVEKCLSHPTDRNETDLCVTEGSVSQTGGVWLLPFITEIWISSRSFCNYSQIHCD